MSEYNVDEPTLRWEVIFHGGGTGLPLHTRTEWYRIADAITTADHALTAAPGMRARADGEWCRVAVHTYTRLAEAGVYADLAPAPGRPTCHADADLIRAWLHAPWVPHLDQPMTMLQAHGFDAAFPPDRLPDPATVIEVVEQAQEWGVFGLPGHPIGLWRYPGDGRLPAHTYTLTIRPPHEPGLCSPLVDASPILRANLGPDQAIVAILQGAASVANRLLSAPGRPQETVSRRPSVLDPATSPLPAGVEGQQVGDPARAFPPLRLLPPPGGVQPTVTPPPQTPQHGPHR